MGRTIQAKSRIQKFLVVVVAGSSAKNHGVPLLKNGTKLKAAAPNVAANLTGKSTITPRARTGSLDLPPDLLKVQFQAILPEPTTVLPT